MEEAFSPDRQFFVSIFEVGDSARDVVQTTLEIWSSVDVATAIESDSAAVPVASVRLCERGSDDRALVWRDADTLQFTGVPCGGAGAGARQAYQFNGRSAALRQLTTIAGPVGGQDRFTGVVGSFDVQGSNVLYKSIQGLTPIEWSRDQVSVVLTTDHFRAEAFPSEIRSAAFVQRGTAPAIEIMPMPMGTALLKLSPDGERGVIGAPLSGRQPGIMTLSLFALEGVEPYHLGVSASPNRNIQAEWSPEGRLIALGNLAGEGLSDGTTALPLRVFDAMQRRAYAVQNLPSTTNVKGLRWEDEASFRADIIRGADGDAAAEESLLVRRVGDQWTAYPYPVRQDVETADRPAFVPNLTVTIDEDINSPPRLIASQGGRRIILSTPDPAIEGVRFAVGEIVSWVGEDGVVERGTLRVPSTGTGPFPLAINVYYGVIRRFNPDGPFPSAYSSQGLVQAGFAVLDLDLNGRYLPPGSTTTVPAANTPLEGELFVQRVDRAVQHLAEQNLIDPARVALIGFSRGAYLVSYAVTHPQQTQYAAAVSDDGWDGDYFGYVFTGAQGRQVDNYVRRVGGTFWEDPEAWLSQAPSFKANQQCTPTLYTLRGAAGINSIFLVAEKFGALRLTQRPFEYIYFPTASHQAFLPSERIASMSLTEDWLRFWVFGTQDADENKTVQYTRWDEIRQRWSTRPDGDCPRQTMRDRWGQRYR